MRFVRKLALVGLSVVAIAGLGAPSAAGESIQVVNEKTGQDCFGYQCQLHLTGLMTLRVDLGIFGEAHEATCNLEVEARVNASGFMLIDALEKTAGDANCATVMTECGQPWSASGGELGFVGVANYSAYICIDPAEGPVCQGGLTFDLVEIAGEGYQAQFNGAYVGLCELDVDLTMESSVTTNATIHINHSN